MPDTYPVSLRTFYRLYTPLTWYWKADDGRVFASERQLIVDETDAGYLDFITAGPPSEWPPDAAGVQTDQALQDLVDDLEIKVGGEPLPVAETMSVPGAKSRHGHREHHNRE
ncbi:hypothetical protein ABID65_007662 [Bradyrhizobium sp. S3.9.2]|uniref:hypothetical protein n=1 Tax=unclassified Bradyrhizobium TaxID=2631580 RepID=UPI0033975A75